MSWLILAYGLHTTGELCLSPVGLSMVNKLAPRRMVATMLGAWTGYDWLLLARVERGQATRRDLLREYWMRYPAVVRPYVTASLRVARDANVFLRVDNPARDPALIRDNASSAQAVLSPATCRAECSRWEIRVE